MLFLKIHQHKTDALLVAPCWKTQVWYPVPLRSLVRPLILAEENKYNLLHIQPSDPNFVHPLANTMRMMVCHVSVESLERLRNENEDKTKTQMTQSFNRFSENETKIWRQNISY